MSARNRGRRLALNAEINVVSLIDVILLLLLIFMITAPMMTGGIDLQLPTASVQQIESKDAVLVEINRAGTVHVDGKVWSMDQLQNMFKTHLKGRDEVTFRADTHVEFGVITRVWSVLNTAGVKGFGVMAIPEETIRR